MAKTWKTANLLLLVYLNVYEIVVTHGELRSGVLATCAEYKQSDASLKDGNYTIDPDGAGSMAPFSVFCDMTGSGGVGVTVISHDSEERTLVTGFDKPGSYSRNITYDGVSLVHLGILTEISTNCEQFTGYECFYGRLLAKGYGWWVSREGKKMRYWGGATPGSKKCACGMNNSCVKQRSFCNCDSNVISEDKGLLTAKADLPVAQLRFGDTGKRKEYAYYTLGKLKCYGFEPCKTKWCLNGGTCKELAGQGYECICPKGFTGKQCETVPEAGVGNMAKACRTNSCLNGGNCTDLVKDYLCNCPEGYTGRRCENVTKRNETTTCSSNPCLNGGNCTDLVNGYVCNCLEGYTGKLCEKGGKKQIPRRRERGFTESWEALSVLIVGILLFVALLFCCVFLLCCCKKDKSKPIICPLVCCNSRYPWEVWRDDLYFNTFLGVGAFGEVWKAEVLPAGGIQGNREVTVKVLRGHTSRDTRKVFIKEIRNGKLLGNEKHSNILRFLGCVTLTEGGLFREDLMIIMEYALYGDLLSFLKQSRGVEDNVHRVGTYIDVRELTNDDLINFAQQVACGMNFLESKGIMHSDLAASNVMVDKNFICKVTNFDLGFPKEKYGYLLADKGGRSPYKWTSPEAWFEKSEYQVSSKSDVWSYGILLYEVFTLGGIPYPDFEDIDDLMAEIKLNGYRMPKPDHISDEIYELMMDCWKENPDDRPTFEELQKTFQGKTAEDSIQQGLA